MWIYVQRTGQLFRDEEEVGCGYSGKGESKNNPAAQEKHNQGPIPVGLYRIDEPRNSLAHGPYVLPLAPHLDNWMFGRSAFLIHGDSITHPGEASEGCIILGRAIRERIWESGERELRVIAEKPE